jgi:hypothetical protein
MWVISALERMRSLPDRPPNALAQRLRELLPELSKSCIGMMWPFYFALPQASPPGKDAFEDRRYPLCHSAAGQGFTIGRNRDVLNLLSALAISGINLAMQGLRSPAFVLSDAAFTFLAAGRPDSSVLECAAK